MLVRVESKSDFVVVRLQRSRLDAAVAQDFADEMTCIVDEYRRRTVFDMSGVLFMDSSGLGAIVQVYKHLGEDGPLELAELEPAVRKVFELTRMSEVFRIHNSLRAA